MFEFLTKLSVNKGLQIGVMIFGNIIAPYWFLFQFFRPLVSDNNPIQQLIICLAIGIPVSLFGFFLELVRKTANPDSDFIAHTDVDINKNIDVDKEKLADETSNKLMFSCLSGASMNTAAVLYMPCIIAFFVTLKPNTAIVSSILAYVVLFILVTIAVTNSLSERKKKLIAAAKKDT